MKTLKSSIIIILISISSLMIPYFAQEVPAEEKHAPTLKGCEKPTQKISIEDVTRMALENSLDIQIAKYDAYIKRTALLRTKSIFDTFINASTNYRHDEKKPASIILGTKIMENTYSLGVDKKLPIGTDLSLNFQHKRTDTDSQFGSLNPSHEAIAGISLKQPIGKNFFGLIDRSTIKITKLDIENAEYTSLQDIETALHNAQAAYWNFVLKNEQLAIKKDMLAEAQKLYEIYLKKHEIGLAEKADLLATEANVTIRESDVLIAYLEKNTAKNDLLFLLNENDLSIQLEPIDSLDTSPFEVDLKNSLSSAIANRRDYKKINNLLKSNNINITVKKNALWPEIDLTATLQRNGLDSRFEKSWDDIIHENNPELILGVTVTTSFENSIARADYKESKLQKQQLIFGLKKTERAILRELNNKVKEVNTLKNQVELFISLVQLQTNKLKEEEKRLKYGRSSSDIIIRYEEDLLNAQLSLASSFSRYRVSLIDLDLAKNTLLDKYWKEEL